MADYTANPDGGGQGNDPTVDKTELIKHVIEIITAAEEYLHGHGFELQQLIGAESFEKLALLKQAANAMCETMAIRKSFCTFATTLLKLWKYLDHEEITAEMKQKKDGIEAIWKELQKKRKHSDITDLSVAINNIVNEHLEVDESIGKLKTAESKRFDISGIDFELLRREFAKSKEKNLLLRDIEELLQERLAQMIAENPSRINFYERYQEIIKSYNQEQNRAAIEKLFEELMRLSHSLTEEQKRCAHEGFENDEEALAVYDLLLKENLSKKEIERLKATAKELLEKIKAELKDMDHPFEKTVTKASIIVTIRDTLWRELPDSYFSEGNLETYRNRVYNYVSQRYSAPIQAHNPS